MERRMTYQYSGGHSPTSSAEQEQAVQDAVDRVTSLSGWWEMWDSGYNRLDEAHADDDSGNAAFWSGFVAALESLLTYAAASVCPPITRWEGVSWVESATNDWWRDWR